MKESLAFDTVNKDSFKELLNGVSSRRLHFPTTKSLMAELNNKYGSLKSKLISLLEKQTFVCTTTDVWSCRGTSYIGFTVHYIDVDFNRKSFVIAFRKLDKKQTHEYLARIISNIHSEFGLSLSKITHTVTDGGSAFVKAFKKYQETTVPVSHAENDSESDEFSECEDEHIAEEEHFDDDIAEVTEAIDHLTFNVMLELDNYQQNADNNENSFEWIDDNSSIVLPKQQRCFCHLLNLLASVDFENFMKSSSAGTTFQSICSRLMNLWNLMKRSSLTKSIVKKNLGCILPIPNKTRWNAKFDAIIKVLGFKDKVN